MGKLNSTPLLSFDQRRRQIRRELFIQRQIDRNHSEPRMLNDGIKLDRQLEAEGYTLDYPTEWARTRQSHQAKEALEDDIGD